MRGREANEKEQGGGEEGGTVRKGERGINGGVPDRCCLRGHYRPLCVFGMGLQKM